MIAWFTNRNESSIEGIYSIDHRADHECKCISWSGTAALIMILNRMFHIETNYGRKRGENEQAK